eukprot:gene31176-40534_t
MRRDYRWYAEDMVHPTPLARKFILGKFSSKYLTEEAQSLATRIDSINRNMNHVPFFPQTEAYRKHLSSTIASMQDIMQQKQNASGSKQQPVPLPTTALPTAADSANNTYVGFVSYRDPYKCKSLFSFLIYPTSVCMVMANTHPDGSAFISGHAKYSCGSNSATAMSYLPTDTTCSQQPYDSYLLPNYGKCPIDAELPMFTCLSDNAVATLSKSARGVVNKVYATQEDCYAQRATKLLYLTYSPTSFLTEDGAPLYRCITSSRVYSYVYVCHGTTAIEKQVFYAANCKGVATVTQRTFFGEYCSGTKLTTLPTCMGPPTL